MSSLAGLMKLAAVLGLSLLAAIGGNTGDHTTAAATPGYTVQTWSAQQQTDSAAVETVTLPVAASAVGAGGVSFVSDVRVFNTSYTDVLTVTAVYRFNGATKQFSLGARESRAFDDICVSLFGAPSSLGAVEFTSSGGAGLLVVSSQLRSPVPGGGFVGMFIPGLPLSAAKAVTVLTGLVNGDSRTNVGVYNPNAVGVTATIRLFDGPVLLGTTSVTLAPRAVTQVNNIYGVVGFGSLSRNNGYATVESSDAGNPLFTYAAEADNKSGDLILVVGAPDVAAPPGFNPPSVTPTGSLTGPTLTPTPTPTPTPTQSSSNIHVVNVGQGGSFFKDAQSGSATTNIRVGDTVLWNWANDRHSTTSGVCTSGGYYDYGSCDSDGKWDSGQKIAPASFSQKFDTAGTFRYYCTVHTAAMTGTVQVNP